MGHYLKVAIRRLKLNRWYSVMNITALAVGFCCFVLSGYWFSWEHSFDGFHPQGDRTFQITRFGARTDVKLQAVCTPVVNRKQVDQILGAVPEIGRHCEVSDGATLTIDIGEEPYAVRLLHTDTAFFSFFSSRFVAGGYRGVPVDGKWVILTESLAKRLFPGRECVGEWFEMGGRRQVAGVISDYPEHSQFVFDCIVLERPGEFYTNWMKLFVRFTDRVRPGDVLQRLSALEAVAGGDETEGLERDQRYRIETLQDVHFSAGSSEMRFRNIGVLYWAGWLVLLVVLANHLVLFFTMQQTRLGNHVTYMSFGASVRDLLAKYGVELLLPVVAGCFLSLLLMEVLFPYYRSFTVFDEQGRMALSDLYRYSAVHLALVVAAFCLLALLLLYWMVSRSTRRSSLVLFNLPLLRRLAVTGQVFIGVLFAVASLSLYRQLLFAEQFGKGLDTAGVIELDMGYSNSQHRIDVGVLRERIAGHSAVRDIALSVSAAFAGPGSVPSALSNSLDLSSADGSLRYKGDFNVAVFDEHYLSFWGFTLKEGVWPEGSDRESFLMNEAAARKIGGKGAGLLVNDDFLFRANRVCGVVEDYHFAPVSDPVSPLFFHLLTGGHFFLKYRYVYVRPETGRKEEAMALLRSVVDEVGVSHRIDRESVVIAEVDGLVRSFYRSERVMVCLFGGIALFSMLISAFAIYVLVSLSAEQRRKEMAIRKINGAVFADILRLFVREYLWLVVCANALAAPVGYLFMQRWLESFTYHIEPGVLFFVLIFAASLLLVYGAVALQVRRAMREDPARVIKSE